VSDVAAHRGWALFLLACLALVPRLTVAAPCQPGEGEPLEQSLAHVADCQDQPSWLAWVGERLNRAGRYAEAVDHLERALLLDPGLLPARLGYLLALAGSGDTEAALALASDMLAQDELPPSVRGPLAQRVERWQRERAQPTAPLATSRTRMSAGLRVGRDSNLLGAPNLDSLTLILAGQPVELPLDDTYRSRPGNYLRLDGNLEHARLLDELAPGMRLDLLLQVRRRLSPQVPQSNLDQVNLAVELSRRWPGTPTPEQALARPAGWYSNLSAGSLDGAIGTRYRTVGLGGGLQWQLRPADTPCEARTGVDVQQRHLASNTVLSGNYGGLQLLLQCEIPGLGLQPVPGSMPATPAWQLALTHGTDRPSDDARPGGAQRQSLLRITGLYGPWLADLDLERRQDAGVYSSLLGDETRQVRRRAARIEWRAFGSPSWPGNLGVGQGGSLELRLGVEWSLQRATIGLFNARSWGPYAAIRYLW
jgi:hypothetical protein